MKPNPKSLLSRSSFALSVYPRRWVFALIGLFCVLAGGLALALVLALGVANPPYAPRLIVSSVAPVNAVIDTLPLTVEMQAYAVDDGAAWGFVLTRDDDSASFLLDPAGYIAADDATDWQAFIHVRRGENTLYLHIEPDGAAVFRVNDEIAWEGAFDVPFSSMLMHFRAADRDVQWRSFRRYGG